MSEIVTNPTESEASATAPGSSKTAKGRPRGIDPGRAAGHLGADRAHHLDPVAHPDGEHQEGHQYRHRIDAVAERGEPAELPDHRDQGTGERRRRQPDRARVDPDEERGDQERDPEEGDDADRAVRDVSHHLGETDHVHVHVSAGDDFAADALQLVRDLDVVEPFAGVGVKLLQPGGNDRAGEVVRYQPPDETGLDDVLPQPGEAGLGRPEIRREHVAGGDAVLDHLDEPHVGGEDRIDLGPVDPRQEERRVGRLAQRGEEPGREHVALAGHHRDQHAVRPAELVAVLEEGLHVFVLDRHQLGEAGVDPEPRRLPPHGQGEERERRQHEAAPGEQQVFDPGGHALVRSGSSLWRATTPPSASRPSIRR